MPLAWHKAPRFGNPEVFALLGALSFLAARFLPVLAVGYVCPFRALTGLPCATCGMTRAFVWLAHGELRPALAASPFGALFALSAWAYAALDLARAAVDAPLPVVPERALRIAVATALGALALNWAYLVLAGGAGR